MWPPGLELLLSLLLSGALELGLTRWEGVPLPASVAPAQDSFRWELVTVPRPGWFLS